MPDVVPRGDSTGRRAGSCRRNGARGTSVAVMACGDASPIHCRPRQADKAIVQHDAVFATAAA